MSLAEHFEQFYFYRCLLQNVLVSYSGAFSDHFSASDVSGRPLTAVYFSLLQTVNFRFCKLLQSVLFLKSFADCFIFRCLWQTVLV